MTDDIRGAGLVDGSSPELSAAILDQLPLYAVAYEVVGPSDFVLALMNDVALVRAGRTRGELIGRHLHEFLTAEQRAGVAALMRTCVETGQVHVVEQQLTTPTGDVWVEARYVPVRGEGGTITHILTLSDDVTERKQRELEAQRAQAEIIEQQAAVLAELSTPLLAISDSTVVMPLVGAIDSRRVQQIMSALLEGVSTSRATVAILDITGVPVVDTQVANALVRAAQSVKLLGAQVVLTGLRPEVAQTLVGLGVDLGGIITRASLQSGIAFAIASGAR